MVERVRLRRINPPGADSSPAEDSVARGFRVYVIRSQTTGAFYIGQTSDLESRLRQHNDPKNKRGLHTRRRRGPWLLVHEEAFGSRPEAMAREKFLKSGQGRLWLRNILGVR